METVIHVDECGYTGEDLYNPEQPIFCIASHCLTVTECEKLISVHMNGVKAHELKHSKLARNVRHQARLLGILHEVAQKHDGAIKFAVAHKHFVLLTKIVDLIIEPLAYEDGIDFYDKGLNIAYSNMLYYMTHHYMGEEFYLEMIKNFQIMVRERTVKAYDRFFLMFFNREFPQDLADLIVFLKASHIRHGPTASHCSG